METSIPFNKPTLTGNEQQYLLRAIQSLQISGDGYFGQKCHRWFEDQLGCNKALLTPSCTAALEMTAMLIDVQAGDEIIMPSYTFVSTANAYVLRGARIVFVDIRPDTMNIDERLIEQAITSKTKAIVVVHYAGVACEMDRVMDIARAYNLFVIEDAAQAMMAKYNDKSLGTMGHFGAISFHETKNFTSGGEGGLLIINDEEFIQAAEIIREKGTNRKQFFKGLVDKYTWVGMGSSYLLSDLQAACLWGQLERADSIHQNRLATWALYRRGLYKLTNQIELQSVPNHCQHNGHTFYIKVKDAKLRDQLINYLHTRNIHAVTHYMPLHNSKAGKQFSTFNGTDNWTSRESQRLLRLPMYYDIEKEFVERTVKAIDEFIGE